VSPDGSTVAYVSDQGGFDPRLWLVDADGTHARTIGPTFGLERLSWAPDGSHLAFTAFRSGKVFTIAADGSDLTRVARGIFPAWSPNGQWIGYLKDSTGDLKRRHPDGSHVMTVVGSTDVPGIGFSDWSVTS
jgi:dipeptidyl aminopeptidase/acylaminoacyl peptidase